MGKVISIDARTELVHVKRSALNVAAENAHAANQNARDAIERAMQHIWSGNRAAAINALNRVGFEVGERTAALMALTGLAETAVACPDRLTTPGHGRAA